jgi:hypothetical protein
MGRKARGGLRRVNHCAFALDFREKQLNHGFLRNDRLGGDRGGCCNLLCGIVLERRQ